MVSLVAQIKQVNVSLGLLGLLLSVLVIIPLT